MATFTLRLIALRCMRAQEQNGDEIYLQIDGETVWAAAPFHMSQHLTSLTRMSEIDFEQGRRQTMNGWEPIPDFKPEAFGFAKTAPATIRLYEGDLFGDDFLGETVASERDAQGGRIQIALSLDGADYMLIYQVTV
jgi:hypothetical protein